MAKIDKKKITHKANSSKSLKPGNSFSSSKPSTGNKGSAKPFVKTIKSADRNLKKNDSAKFVSKNKTEKDFKSSKSFSDKGKKGFTGSFAKKEGQSNSHNSKSISRPSSGGNANFSSHKSIKKQFQPLPLKSQKKEVKIEVISSKKEFLKKQEQKKIEAQKNQQNRNVPKEPQKKIGTDKSSEVSSKIQMKSAQVDTVKNKTQISVKDDELNQKKSTKEKDSAVVDNKKPVFNKKTKDKTKDKNKDKNELDLDDAFISDDDDGGGSEIEEYEEDLKIVEEIDIEVEEEVIFDTDVKEKNYEDINLRDAEGNLLCRARDCDQVSTVDGYCRYHYLLFWKKIQVRKKILADGKLERYVDELTSRYPDKFLEMIRRDLRTQKDFLGAIQELEIDEAGLDNEFEEDTQTYIDEVRGINETSGSIDEEYE